MSFTVDVHHHILPDFFFRETNDAHNPVGGIAPPPWDAELMLSFMDAAGVDVAVTSISTPGVHVGDDARARSLARRCNELSATLVQAHPNRLGGFAALPLPDVDGALEELAYALDTLKLDGVVLFSNANGVYLGDARFEPVFAELEWAQGGGVRASHGLARSIGPPPRPPGFPDRFHGRHHPGGGADALQQPVRSDSQREIHLLARRRHGALSRGALGHRRRDECHSRR